MKYPRLKETISLIQDNGGKAILAHPGINLGAKDTMLDEIIALGIDGIEVFSSYHNYSTAYHLSALIYITGLFHHIEKSTAGLVDSLDLLLNFCKIKFF